MENNDDIEFMREYLRGMFGNISDEELDELIASGEVEVNLYNFDTETQNKMDKIIRDPDAGPDAMFQQINYLMQYGEHEEISDENGMKMFKVGEKKFSDEDTSNVEPISSEEFDRLMGS